LILFDDNYKMDSGFRRNDTAQNRVFRETQLRINNNGEHLNRQQHRNFLSLIRNS